MKKKSPENTSAAKRLIGYLKPYRKKVALLLICAVVGVIFLITGPSGNGDQCDHYARAV